MYARLQDTTLVDTWLELNVKFRKDDGTLLSDPTIYWKLVRSIVYLTIPRPNISHAVNLVSQFMTQSTHLHLAAVKCIIRYLFGTPAPGIFFLRTSTLNLRAYSDVDWATDTTRSTTGWCILLADALISWKCKKQDLVSKCSTKV